MVLRLLFLLFWIPPLLTACVNVAPTNPACPDCGDTLQTDPSASAQESESNANVENPIRSLDNPSTGDPDQTATNIPMAQPATPEETAPRGLTDAEVDELIAEVVVSPEELGDAGLVPADPANLREPGFVDRWGFPLLAQVGPDVLLGLFIDGLSFGLLPPDQPQQQDNPSGFTQLELQCIAQGEPEFICRQRFGQ